MATEHAEPFLIDAEPLIELLGQALRLYHEEVDYTSALGEAIEDALTSLGASDQNHPVRVLAEQRRVELQLDTARRNASRIEGLELEARLLEEHGTTAIYGSADWLTYEERGR